MSTVLVAEGVSKRFRIRQNRAPTLKGSFIRCFTGQRHHADYLWALRDISFSLEEGRVLGMIGHNGAGKSTLLRLISGLGRPTAGRISYRGHLGALLELGNGFHPDLTGRQNLRTGGLLSGLTRQQLKSKEEEIIAFSELEEFIDQPIRTYSSGMHSRLAFSAAINFEPDFLVIDEILAVGDARFQAKCLERLKSFRRSGKGFILVSHDLEQVKALCDEVMVLEEGRLIMHGDPDAAINCYYDLMRQRTERRARLLGDGIPRDLPLEQGSRLGTQEATISAVQMFDGQGRPTDMLQSGDNFTVVLEYSLSKPLSDMAVIVAIYNETDLKCLETAIPSMRTAFGPLKEKGTLSCLLPKLPLLSGRYYVVVGLYPPDWSYFYDYHWQMHGLNVLIEDGIPPGLSGVVSVKPVWALQGPQV